MKGLYLMSETFIILFGVWGMVQLSEYTDLKSFFFTLI